MTRVMRGGVIEEQSRLDKRGGGGTEGLDSHELKKKVRHPAEPGLKFMREKGWWRSGGLKNLGGHLICRD